MTRSDDYAGRRSEMSSLRIAVEEAAAGQGQLILVAGEAGIGKTRLVEEVMASADAIVLWGGCWAGDGVPVFRPWVQLLGELMQRDELRSSRRDLSADLAEVEGWASARISTAEGDRRFRFFDSAARLITHASTLRPLVLVIEDLHWADEPSLRLLLFLARNLRNTRLLVIGTYRDTDLDASPLACHLDDLTTSGLHMHLVGLTATELADWLPAIAPEGGPVERLASVLHRRTAGNPFFVRELVALLVVEGRLAEVSARLNVRVPDSVRAVLSRRLAHLSQTAHDVLVAAAVAGAEFDLEIVRIVTGLAAGKVLPALEEASHARIIAERDGTGRFGFTHALMRDTLYGNLGLATRATLHRAVAEALEQRGVDGDRVADVAHHYLQAASLGDHGKALDYAARAADHAMGMLAFEEAAAWCDRALRLVSLAGSSRGSLEADLLLAAGDARRSGGDLVGSRDAFLRAAGVARDLGDVERLATAALGLGGGLGGFEVELFDLEQCDLLDEARRALGDGDHRLLAWVLARLSVALSLTGSIDRRRALSDEAVAMARRLDDGAALAYALAARCDARAGPDHSEARERDATEVVRLARESRDRPLELLGRRLRLVALLEQGRIGDADIEIDGFTRVAEELRQPLYRWYGPLWRGMRALMCGELDVSERFCNEAAGIGEAMHSGNAAMVITSQRWIRLRARGRYGEAGRLIDDVFATYEQDAGVSGWRGITLLQQGKLREARPLVRRLAEEVSARPMDAEWLPEMATLAQAAVALQDPELAKQVFERTLAFADRFVVESIGAACCGSMTCTWLSSPACSAGRTTPGPWMTAPARPTTG